MLKEFFFKNKKELLLLLLILLVAAFMRLYRIADYMTFLGDEGRDVLVVKRIIVDHKWTLLGPTASVGGFFLGPIYYYLMVPFLWLWKLDPVGPAVMVALFGIATVFLVYKVGRDFFNREVGLVAAALYSVSPLVIAYSRSSWNPNLVPFFSLLYIWALAKIKNQDHHYWWFLAGFLIGIGLQLHYLFTFLIFIGGLFLVVFGKGLRAWKNWLVKLLGVVVGWSPFLVFELRHGFANARTLYRFLFFSQEAGFSLQRVPLVLKELPFRLFSRLVFYFPPQEQFYRYSSGFLFFWRALVVLLGFGSLVLLVFLVARKKQARHWLLLIWLVAGVGLFIFYQKEVYDYYLGFMFPLPFLMIGYLLFWLWSQKKPIRFLAIGLFLGILGLNWFGRPFKFPPNRQLAQSKQIAETVLEKAEGKPFNFALITGGNSDHAYRYFLELWGHSPVTIESPQVDPERKTVTNQLLVVCETLPCHPLGHSLWEIAGFGRAEVAGSWPVSVVEIQKLRHWEDEEAS